MDKRLATGASFLDRFLNAVIKSQFKSSLTKQVDTFIILLAMAYLNLCQVKYGIVTDTTFQITITFGYVRKQNKTIFSINLRFLVYNISINISLPFDLLENIYRELRIMQKLYTYYFKTIHLLFSTKFWNICKKWKFCLFPAKYLARANSKC